MQPYTLLQNMIVLQGFLIHALALSPSFCGFLSSFEEI